MNVYLSITLSTNDSVNTHQDTMAPESYFEGIAIADGWERDNFPGPRDFGDLAPSTGLISIKGAVTLERT